MCRRLLSTSPHGCLLFADWLSCCILLHCTASTSCHLLSCHRLACPTSTPCLHSHWLVVVLHLVELLPPPVLSSTPLPLDALPPHVPPVTHLPFASRLPQLVTALPLVSPLPHIRQLTFLITSTSCRDLFSPALARLCCLPSTCTSVTTTLYLLSRRWLVVVSSA
jgi:hypothetical protein